MKISIFAACLLACPILCNEKKQQPIDPAEISRHCAAKNPGKNLFFFFTTNNMEVDNSKRATATQHATQNNQLTAPHPVAASALMIGCASWVAHCIWSFYKATRG